MSKLTLSIKQGVIEEAKNYAKAQGKSLSSIVEEYLKSLTTGEQLDRKTKSIKLVRALRGSVRLPEGLDSYKEVLQDALEEKYLK
jgi:hypothetical protein